MKDHQPRIVVDTGRPDTAKQPGHGRPHMRLELVDSSLKIGRINLPPGVEHPVGVVAGSHHEPIDQDVPARPVDPKLRWLSFD